MKGLLIKDIRYLIGQKASIAIFIGLGLYFLLTETDVSFAMVFSMIMAAVFSTSSISYDNYENGMAFLLTLPVRKKTYVVSKYVFSLFVVVAMGSLIGILATLCATSGIGDVELSTLGGGMAAGFAAAIVMLAVMIPVYIIFGAEKARVALLVVYGIVFAVGFLVKNVAGGMLEKIVEFGMKLNEMGAVQLGLMVVGVLAVILVVSLLVTMKVVEKKEY